MHSMRMVRKLPADAIEPLYTTEHANDIIPLFDEYDMELEDFNWAYIWDS